MQGGGRGPRPRHTPLTSASMALRLANSAPSSAKGTMFGPSEGALSGLSCASTNTPATPTATVAHDNTASTRPPARVTRFGSYLARWVAARAERLARQSLAPASCQVRAWRRYQVCSTIVRRYLAFLKASSLADRNLSVAAAKVRPRRCAAFSADLAALRSYIGSMPDSIMSRAFSHAQASVMPRNLPKPI